MPHTLAQLDDEDLFRRCRDTEDPAFLKSAVSILAGRHAEGLTRFLYGFVRSREAAEDLAQEAFIRIYKHARGYREVAKVKTWLYRIAQNLALNELRSRRRKPQVSLEQALQGRDGGAPRELEDPRSLDPARDAQDRDRQRTVRDAVDALPEHYRGAVLLCDLEGFTYQEAADVLGTKVGTIRSRLFRAREQLAQALLPMRTRGSL